MTKLTEAQRSVIERMANGATLCVQFQKAWLVDGDGFRDINRQTAQSLMDRKFVYRTTRLSHGLHHRYKVTTLGRSLAQQKNPPPPN